MVALRLWILAVAGLAAACVRAEEPRTWTDAAGRKVEATFVRVHGGDVILDKDGKMMRAPLARFSPADQQYIRELTSGKAGPASDAASKSSKAQAARGADNQSAAPRTTDAKQANEPSKSDQGDEQKAKAAAAELRRVREWKDNFGNSVKARFERFFGEQVVLVQGNKPRTVNFSELSGADQDFLRRNFEAQGKGAEVPSAVAKANAAGAAGNEAAQAALASSLSQLAGALANGAGAPGSRPSGFPTPPSPQGGLPNFSGLTEQMRNHQEQMRQEHEKVRDRLEQFKQKTDQMRAERDAARANIRRTEIARSSVPRTNVAGAAQGGYGGPPSPAVNPATPSAATASPATAATPNNEPTFNWPFGPMANAQTPPPNAEAPFPSANPPADPFGGLQSAAPQYEQVAVIVCGSCGKQQRPGFKAGDRCQHCGRTIDEIKDESGKVVDRSVRATGKTIKMWVWIVITVIGVIGGAIAKLRG